MLRVNIALNVGTNERDRQIAQWLERQPNKSDAIKSALAEKAKE